MTVRPSLLKRIFRGFLAAVTSPRAVAQERSLAAEIVTSMLLAVGASAGLVSVVASIISG